MIVSPNAIIHLVRFFVRCTLYTCAPSLTRTDFFLQGVEASGHDPVRNWILIKIRAMMARIFYYSGRHAKISLKFYGQSAFFCWFVRKQNAFYGQTVIFRWFVRKFLAIMLRIYGQSRLFGAFVRKIESETSEFLRTTGHFWPFCP